MIELQFTQSPDKNILGHYQTYASELTLGSSNQSDIIICDEYLHPLHLKIELLKDGPLIYNLHKDGHFLSNKKKIGGKKLHQKQDHIRIGETEFIIKDFNYELSQDSSDFLLNAYKEKIHKNPTKGILFEALQDELKYLGQEQKKKSMTEESSFPHSEANTQTNILK